MPTYDYRCDCGLRFEHLVPSALSPAPDCPRCSGATRRVPSTFGIGGRASAGRSQTEMPQTWRGTYDGNREYVGRLQRQWAERQRLEERHPELQGDRRPIIAHEGAYEHAPLRSGDTAAVGHPSEHSHSHGHEHGPGHHH
jgi:putative FmdB family regulatory protein